jgi:hypothetical protein
MDTLFLVAALVILFVIIIFALLTFAGLLIGNAFQKAADGLNAIDRAALNDRRGVPSRQLGPWDGRDSAQRLPNDTGDRRRLDDALARPQGCGFCRRVRDLARGIFTLH